MHNVLKSSLLDVTIDKLSIVADFKEGIKKEEFIRMVASSNMPYSLQANRSRNFVYEEVLKMDLNLSYIDPTILDGGLLFLDSVHFPFRNYLIQLIFHLNY